MLNSVELKPAYMPIAADKMVGMYELFTDRNLEQNSLMHSDLATLYHS